MPFEDGTLITSVKPDGKSDWPKEYFSFVHFWGIVILVICFAFLLLILISSSFKWHWQVLQTYCYKFSFLIIVN